MMLASNLSDNLLRTVGKRAKHFTIALTHVFRQLRRIGFAAKNKCASLIRGVLATRHLCGRNRHDTFRLEVFCISPSGTAVSVTYHESSILGIRFCSLFSPPTFSTTDK